MHASSLSCGKCGGGRAGLPYPTLSFMFWIWTSIHLTSTVFLLCMTVAGMSLCGTTPGPDGTAPVFRFMFVRWLRKLRMFRVSAAWLFSSFLFGSRMLLQIPFLRGPHMFVIVLQRVSGLVSPPPTSRALQGPVGLTLFGSISLGSSQLPVHLRMPSHSLLAVLISMCFLRPVG